MRSDKILRIAALTGGRNVPVVAFSRGVFSVGRVQRFVAVIGVLGTTAGLVASAFRASMFGFGMSLLILLGVGIFRRRQWKGIRTGSRRIVAYTVIVALIVLPLVGAFLVVDGREEYHVRQLLTLANPLQDRNLQARWEIWKGLGRFVSTNPFGYGTGSLGSTTYRYGEVLGFHESDKQYIETTVETGVAGLLLLISILGIV